MNAFPQSSSFGLTQLVLMTIDPETKTLRYKAKDTSLSFDGSKIELHISQPDDKIVQPDYETGRIASDSRAGYCNC
jgi:hypothetical protein